MQDLDLLTFSGCICSMKQFIKKLNIAANDNNVSDMNVAVSKIYSAQKGAKLCSNILTYDDRLPNLWKRVFENSQH